MGKGKRERKVKDKKNFSTEQASKTRLKLYRHALSEVQQLGGVGDRRVGGIEEHLVDGLPADVGGDDDDAAVAGTILAEGLNEFGEVQGHGRRQRV